MSDTPSTPPPPPQNPWGPLPFTPSFPSTPAPFQTPKKNRKGAFAIGFGFVVAIGLGVALGNSSEPEETGATLPDPGGVVSDTTSEVEVDDEIVFAAAFAAEYQDDMEQGLAAMNAATDALDIMDVSEGANQSALASRIFGDIASGARGLEGADSDLGRTIIASYDTCSDAYNTAAVAISDFDIPGMERAATEIGNCGARMSDSTDALEDVTGLG